MLLTAAHSTNVLRAALWYLGNYYYNIFNKKAAKSSGGAEFAFTLATIQLVVGSLYALFLWAAPEARAKPKMTFSQVVALAPLGFFAAAAHAGAAGVMWYACSACWYACAACC